MSAGKRKADILEETRWPLSKNLKMLEKEEFDNEKISSTDLPKTSLDTDSLRDNDESKSQLTEEDADADASDIKDADVSFRGEEADADKDQTDDDDSKTESIKLDQAKELENLFKPSEQEDLHVKKSEMPRLASFPIHRKEENKDTTDKQIDDLPVLIDSPQKVTNPSPMPKMALFQHINTGTTISTPKQNSGAFRFSTMTSVDSPFAAIAEIDKKQQITEEKNRTLKNLASEKLFDRTESSYSVNNVETEAKTGEEDEELYFSTRAKLFVMNKDTKSWKERGTGNLRINVLWDAEQSISKSRLVMRTEQVLKVILNVSLFPEMDISKAEASSAVQSDNFVKFIAFEDGVIQHFALKTKDSVAAQLLITKITEALPAKK